MKQTILSLIFILSSLSVIAQIPQWVISPECDTIFVKTSGLLQGRVKGENVIWAMDGKKLYSTSKHINDFNDGIATIQDLDSGLLLGFIDLRGRFHELPETYATYDYPYFRDGFLVAKNNDNYELYSKDGEAIAIPQLHTLYPYSNGYASYLIFLDPLKLKKNHFNFLKPNGQPLETYVINEKDKRKEIEPKDLTFISSIGENGKAIAIVKNKLYWFDKVEMCLTPILMGEETDKKRHLTLDSKKTIDFAHFPLDTLTIYTQYGKDQNLELHFDNRLRLLSDDLSTEPTATIINKSKKTEFKSVLTSFSDGKAEGLILNDKDSIPSQFESIGQKYENKAFVKSKGKWGVLALVPESNIGLVVNEGETIHFSHQSLPTTLKIYLPSIVKSENMTIEVVEDAGIHLDRNSIKRENSDNFNIVTYACNLDVPSELTDTVTDISYGPISLLIDGVRLPKRNINTKGLFINHFNINIPSKEATVDNRKAIFDIFVNSKEENLDSLNNINIEVAFESEALVASSEKISENVYRCTVDSLSNGINNLVVKVAEKGCPFSKFPIEIEYANNRKKETVTVRQVLDAVKPEIPTELVGQDENPLNSNDENIIDNYSYIENDFTPFTYDTEETHIGGSQKVNFNNGYMIVEVVSDNADFRIGAGTGFPITTVNDLESGKSNTKYPHKGQLLIVKEVNDWYRIHPNFFNQKNTEPKYISKIDAKPLMSNVFYLDEITKPTTYVKVIKETNEYGESGYFAETLVVYPGGTFIQNKDSFWTSTLSIGNIFNGSPVLVTNYTLDSSFEYDRTNEKDRTMRLIDSKNKDKREIRFVMPVDDKKFITKNDINVPYPDLSKFNEDEWRSVMQKIMSTDMGDKKELIIVDEPSKMLVITKDMLNKNYIKN